VTSHFLPGQTGLVILVPEIEPLVGHWRRHFEPAAALGVGAHVTVLFPFAPLGAVDHGTIADLERLFVDVAPFELSLTGFARFPDGALYLEPEPSERVRRLTEMVARRWPEFPPYGGAFAEIIPHLTVSVGVEAEIEKAIEAAVTPTLPIVSPVDAIHLMSFDGAAWTMTATFPLGALPGWAAR